MQIDASIFKAYDIRGVYPTSLDEGLAQKIGEAFAALIRTETHKDQPTIVVSRDMRLSSPQLRAAVVEGLTSMGAHVIDIGLASTPTFYFAVGYLEADGGLQVSASHNPSEYNGIKAVRSMGRPVSGDDGIYTMRDMIVSDSIPSYDGATGSITERDDVLSALVDEFVDPAVAANIKPFKVVVDAANAMAALDCEAVFAKLPCELIRVNFDLDGSFPSHEADPLKDENLVLLQEEVVKHGADLGFSTDGDGDRYFVVMENGQRLSPEILRGILAQRVLAEFPGARIGYDIRPGKITEDMIVEAGGDPFITRVGHSLIKAEMIKEDSPFSGESSGHFFYRTQFGSYETPAKMLVDFLLWLTEQNRPLSKIAAPLNRYFHSGEINSVVADTAAVFTALKDKYQPSCKRFSDMDGVLFEFDEYWFNVRASNTEPKMRLNLEARSQAVMEEKRDEVLALIRQDS